MGKHSDESRQVSSMSVREEILNEALRITKTDRNTAYGEPEDNFGNIADFWSVYLDGKDVDSLDGVDVAAMMVLMKIARLKHNPNHRDSWVDTAGYAACGGQAASKIYDEPKWKDLGFTEDDGIGNAFKPSPWQEFGRGMFMAPVSTPEPTNYRLEYTSMDGRERVVIPNAKVTQNKINVVKERVAEVQQEVQANWRNRDGG